MIEEIKKLALLSEKPEIFQNNTALFWDDDHISKEMLKAHLDPYVDAASRKHGYIKRSAEWIVQRCDLKPGGEIIDLGCGPGLYSLEFAKRGYNVTGIDYSKRSIDYAKCEAAKAGFDIKYIYEDYMNMDFDSLFDLAVLIYCDFGVLSPRESAILLKKIYKALKPGGCFMFDVFTKTRYANGNLCTKNWEICKNGGFWRIIPYISLQEHFIYEDTVHLDQILVLDGEGEVERYLIWDQTYEKHSISDLLLENGFSDISITGGLCNEGYDKETSEIIGVYCEKK